MTEARYEAQGNNSKEAEKGVERVVLGGGVDPHQGFFRVVLLADNCEERIAVLRHLITL
jgi:hypothetical protein